MSQKSINIKKPKSNTDDVKITIDLTTEQSCIIDTLNKRGETIINDIIPVIDSNVTNKKSSFLKVHHHAL